MFLREVYAGGREARPIPAALGDGRCVDLLRLFLAVRDAGGYAGVPSTRGGWAAAAESAGVDASLAAPVKHLGALERWIQRLVEAHGPFLDGDRGEQRHVMLKRKRGDMVGLLGWVKEIAENAGDGGAVAAGSVDEYFSVALAVRKVVNW